MRIIRTDTLEPTSPLTRNEQDWVYNGLDVCVTFEIVDALLDQLDNVSRATYERSLALQGPILEMSTRGLRVDRQRRDEVLAMYRRNIQLVSDQLNEILRDGIGIDLNWRSPAQLKKLFYEVLGLPVIRKRNANGIMYTRSVLELIKKPVKKCVLLEKQMCQMHGCINIGYSENSSTTSVNSTPKPLHSIEEKGRVF